MEFAVFWSIDMLMESALGAVRRNIRFQTGGGFQPVVDVVAGLAAALLVEMIGVIANIVLGRLCDRCRMAGGGLILHRCCCFRHKGKCAHALRS